MSEKPLYSNCKFMSFDASDITDELRLVAEKQLNETDERRATCLTTLAQRLREKKHLISRTNDDFLIPFLRARKFDSNAALKLVKQYYKHKKTYPMLYAQYTPEDVFKVQNSNLFNFLPHRSPEGYAIWACRIGAWEPDDYPFEEVVKFGFMCNEVAWQNPVTQILGTVAVVDMKGLSFNKIMHLSVSNISGFISGVQECMPMRQKAIHILHNPMIFSIIFSLIKPLLNKKIKERIHFHGSDLSSLHKYLPVEILPEEFGGDQGPLRNDAFYQSLMDSQDYFISNQKYGYSRRRSSLST